MIHARHPAADFFGFRMTLRAANLSVRPFKRIRSLAVIELGRTPFRNGVARRTILLLARRHELAAVNVLMALKALAGRGIKFDGALGSIPRERALRWRWRMTSRASHRLVRAFQRKFRFCMIEAAQFAPLARVMTGLTIQASGVCSRRQAFRLDAMRIHVAAGAALVIEVIEAGDIRNIDGCCVGN